MLHDKPDGPGRNLGAPDLAGVASSTKKVTPLAVPSSSLRPMLLGRKLRDRLEPRSRTARASHRRNTLRRAPRRQRGPCPAIIDAIVEREGPAPSWRAYGGEDLRRLPPPDGRGGASSYPLDPRFVSTVKGHRIGEKLRARQPPCSRYPPHPPSGRTISADPRRRFNICNLAGSSRKRTRGVNGTAGGVGGTRGRISTRRWPSLVFVSASGPVTLVSSASYFPWSSSASHYHVRLRKFTFRGLLFRRDTDPQNERAVGGNFPQTYSMVG